MFAAYLEDPAVWQPLLLHPVLKESLAWLTRSAQTAEQGHYALGRPGWYAQVHGYATLPESACRWENHTRTVDIQYLSSGSEGIRWAPARQLGTPSRFLEEKDRQEFDATIGPTVLVALRPGMFVIFLPGEAHCPKIALGGSEVLQKTVVKIPLCLLTGSATPDSGGAGDESSDPEERPPA